MANGNPNPARILIKFCMHIPPVEGFGEVLTLAPSAAWAGGLETL